MGLSYLIDRNDIKLLVSTKKYARVNGLVFKGFKTFGIMKWSNTDIKNMLGATYKDTRNSSLEVPLND